MTSFTWIVTSLSSSVDTGLVKHCYFTCSHASGSFEGSATLPEIDVLSPNFVAYEELDETTVLQWLFETLGDEKTVVEEVASRESAILNPPTPDIVNGKPW